MIKQLFFLSSFILLLLAACNPAPAGQEAAPAVEAGARPVVEMFRVPT